jgi:hypothetical protein
LYFEMTLRPHPTAPTRITILAACVIVMSIVLLNVAAQTPNSESVSVSKDIIDWVIRLAAAASVFAGIGYGFVKKQKYDNLENERNELKSLAESREERIKECQYTLAEREARYKLELSVKDREVVELKESRSALVSQSLQMKAILRGLRLNGNWSGHEERIHETLEG